MSDKRAVIKNADGSCDIVIPSPRWLANYMEKNEDVSEDDAMQYLIDTKYNDTREKRITTTDKIPLDRTFRNAWTDDNPTQTIDVVMSKARQIHMDRIRIARDKRLRELDKRKYGAEFDAERQALRDLPQTFDLSGAKDPDELKALWPEELS